MSDKPAPLILRNGGRGKVTITDAGIAAIEKLAANGQSNVTIARSLGIHPETLNKLRDDEDDDRVLLALDTGRGRLADELTDILLTHAREGSITAAIYLSKARLGWRDQGAIPQTANATQVNINIPAPMSKEDFDKLVNVKKVPTDGN
ncbi:MAG: hypothetical protein AAFX76_13250 [Planctomycetota bacterium]